MINLHERMLPTSAGVEPATSWSPVGRRIQLSHRGRHMQAVETLIRRRILRSLIWVCTVCQLPFYGSPDYNGLKKSQYLGLIQYFCNIQVRSLINLQSANHNRSRRHSDVLYIRIIPEKIRLNILYEASAYQTIQLKCHVLFSL